MIYYVFVYLFMTDILTYVSTTDYTLDYDTSITEEEMEKSLREVLPSEGQRKELKRKTSQNDFPFVSLDNLELPPGELRAHFHCQIILTLWLYSNLKKNFYTKVKVDV